MKPEITRFRVFSARQAFTCTEHGILLLSRWKITQAAAKADSNTPRKRPNGRARKSAKARWMLVGVALASALLLLSDCCVAEPARKNGAGTLRKFAALFPNPLSRHTGFPTRNNPTTNHGEDQTLGAIQRPTGQRTRRL